VKAELVAAGIDAGRLATQGFGSEHGYLVHGKETPNDNDKHRAMNRRVEFHVQKLGTVEWVVVDPDAAP